MNISIDKQYKTKSGREVKIYFIGEDYVHGACKGDTKWFLCEWTSTGAFDLINYYEPRSYDLVEVKPKVEIDFWVNVYPKGLRRDGVIYSMYTTKAVADSWSTSDRIACINIKRSVEHGEGI